MGAVVVLTAGCSREHQLPTKSQPPAASQSVAQSSQDKPHSECISADEARKLASAGAKRSRWIAGVCTLSAEDGRREWKNLMASTYGNIATHEDIAEMVVDGHYDVFLASDEPLTGPGSRRERRVLIFIDTRHPDRIEHVLIEK